MCLYHDFVMATMHLPAVEGVNKTMTTLALHRLPTIMTCVWCYEYHPTANASMPSMLRGIMWPRCCCTSVCTCSPTIVWCDLSRVVVTSSLSPSLSRSLAMCFYRTCPVSLYLLLLPVVSLDASSGATSAKTCKAEDNPGDNDLQPPAWRTPCVGARWQIGTRRYAFVVRHASND